MWARGITTALIVLLGWSTDLGAQRPWLSFGVGGGVVLGSPLIEHDLRIEADDREDRLTQRIDLDDVGIVSANADVYLTRRIALHAQVARGDGRLRAETQASGNARTPQDAEAARIGRVRINAIDAGITFWPWAPGTIGFAPFATAGIGRFTYDFDAASDPDYFHASGSRGERSFQLGLGADLHIWRSVLLRFEAVNHRVDSPLQPGDFVLGGEPGASSAFSDPISSVRLGLAIQLLVPFRSGGLSGD